MYPNPQDVLPLPARPNLEQYKKQAKDLVRGAGPALSMRFTHGRRGGRITRRKLSASRAKR